MAGNRGAGARKRRRIARASARQGGNLSTQLAARAEAREARVIHQRPMTAEEMALFTVVGATGLPLGDRTEKWDGPAAEKSYTLPGDAGCFMWRGDGDPKVKGSYSLPFVSKDGTKHAVWGAITAIAGVLSGARGGVKGMSPADTAAVKKRVEAYYSAAKTKFKDDDIKVPWADDKAENETEAYLLARAELGADADETLMALRVAAWEEQFAAAEFDYLQVACDNCDDPRSAHLGDDNDGPCTADDCDCSGFQEPDGDAAVVESGQYVGVQPDLDGFEIVNEGGITIQVPEVELALNIIQNAANGDPALRESIIVRLADFKLAGPDSDIEGTIPDAHKPGSRQPPRHSSPKAHAAPAPPPDTVGAPPVTWSAIFAPEGKLTSDGRAFAPGAIEWRDLPLTLMAMTETSEGGHIGAEVAGRIDNIWRDDEAGLIRASGVFADTDYGNLIAAGMIQMLGGNPEDYGLTASLVSDETLRGLSVDLAIADYVVGPKAQWFDADGNWAPQEAAGDDEPSLIDLYADDNIAVITKASIGCATVCPFPAFAEARIAADDSLVAGANCPPNLWTVTLDAGWRLEASSRPLTASAGGGDADAPCLPCAEVEALTASAEGLVPVLPPAAWFEDPQLPGPTAITVTDEGQVYGHAGLDGICHIGLPGQCQTIPHSNTDYAYFHLGEIECDDGSRVACGQITLDTNHAPLSHTGVQATAHYDNTGTVVAHVRSGEDEYGVWVAGALMPDAPAEKVRLLRGSKLSGDWRNMDGHRRELVAWLCVNVPGFPVPRAQASLTASADGEMEADALIAVGIPVLDDELTADERERFRALQARARFADLAAEAA